MRALVGPVGAAVLQPGFLLACACPVTRAKHAEIRAEDGGCTNRPIAATSGTG
jgi:hypothetical protein